MRSPLFPQAPENTTTYIVALAQFVVLALVFNKGMPHRSPLWTNKWLVLVLVVQVGSGSQGGTETAYLCGPCRAHVLGQPPVRP